LNDNHYWKLILEMIRQQKISLRIVQVLSGLYLLSLSGVTIALTSGNTFLKDMVSLNPEKREIFATYFAWAASIVGFLLILVCFNTVLKKKIGDWFGVEFFVASLIGTFPLALIWSLKEISLPSWISDLPADALARFLWGTSLILATVGLVFFILRIVTGLMVYKPTDKTGSQMKNGWKLSAIISGAVFFVSVIVIEVAVWLDVLWFSLNQWSAAKILVGIFLAALIVAVGALLSAVATAKLGDAFRSLNKSLHGPSISERFTVVGLFALLFFGIAYFIQREWILGILGISTFLGLLLSFRSRCDESSGVQRPLLQTLLTGSVLSIVLIWLAISFFDHPPKWIFGIIIDIGWCILWALALVLLLRTRLSGRKLDRFNINLLKLASETACIFIVLKFLIAIACGLLLVLNSPKDFGDEKQNPLVQRTFAFDSALEQIYSGSVIPLSAALVRADESGQIDDQEQLIDLVETECDGRTLQERYAPALSALLLAKAFLGNAFGLHLAMYILFFYGLRLIQKYCSGPGMEKWGEVQRLRKLLGQNEEERESFKQVLEEWERQKQNEIKDSAATGGSENSSTKVISNAPAKPSDQKYFRLIVGKINRFFQSGDRDGKVMGGKTSNSSNVDPASQETSSVSEEQFHGHSAGDDFHERAKRWLEGKDDERRTFNALVESAEQDADRFDRLTSSHLAGIRDQLSVMGLLGTVVGLSSAIYSTAATEADKVFKGISPEVSSQLGTAFFTTLVALSLRMALFFYLSRKSLEDPYASHLLGHLSTTGGSH